MVGLSAQVVETGALGWGGFPGCSWDPVKEETRIGLPSAPLHEPRPPPGRALFGPRACSASAGRWQPGPVCLSPEGNRAECGSAKVTPGEMGSRLRSRDPPGSPRSAQGPMAVTLLVRAPVGGLASGR